VLKKLEMIYLIKKADNYALACVINDKLTINPIITVLKEGD